MSEPKELSVHYLAEMDDEEYSKELGRLIIIVIEQAMLKEDYFNLLNEIRKSQKQENITIDNL